MLGGQSNQRHQRGREEGVDAVVHIFGHAQVRFWSPCLAAFAVDFLLELSLVLFGIAQLLAKGTTPLVDETTHRGAIIALELGMMTWTALRSPTKKRELLVG